MPKREHWASVFDMATVQICSPAENTSNQYVCRCKAAAVVVLPGKTQQTWPLTDALTHTQTKNFSYAKTTGLRLVTAWKLSTVVFAQWPVISGSNASPQDKTHQSQCAIVPLHQWAL